MAAPVPPAASCYRTGSVPARCGSGVLRQARTRWLRNTASARDALARAGTRRRAAGERRPGRAPGGAHPSWPGTVLSLAAVAAIAGNDPAAAFPRLSARHPLASYRALAAAPFGNGLELFALVAFIYFACIFVAGWRQARRRDRRRLS